MNRGAMTEELTALIAAHAAEIAALKAENETLAQRVTHLEEQLRLERLHRYAPRSEKLKDRIFNEAEQAAAEAEETDDVETAPIADTGLADAEQPEPKKRGRRPLPDGLPRERVEHDLPEEQKVCSCCRNRMHRMGEIVSEQLHIEVKSTVLQHVRFKYACRHCERTALRTPIVTAPMPAQPLPGSIAAPATLALVLANKYVDGTPLYRLEQALARANISISRGALGNWVIRSADLHLLRLYEVLKQKLRSQPLVHGDETWVQVLKEDGRDAQAKSFMWAYRSGQDSEQPIVVFDYQPGRGQEHPQAFLGDYRGLLMSDGYNAWRTLDGAIHLGCMAHARRKFTDALKARKKPGGPAVQALKFFEALYEVERLARQAPSEGETRADYTLRLRQQHSIPVLAAFKTWLDDLAPKVLPGSFTGKAIAYAQNQWNYLIRYASNGLAPIDNNVLERDIRPFVTPRSLCPSCSSIWKHWKLIRSGDVTRAPFAPGSFHHGRCIEVGGADLERRAGYNLLGMKDPRLDQLAYPVVGNAASLSCLAHGQPDPVLLGGFVGMNVADTADRADPVRCPGLALPGRQSHPVERGSDVLIRPAARHAANDRQGVVGSGAAVFARARLTQAQFGVPSALPMNNQNDLLCLLVDVDDDLVDEGAHQLLAAAHGDTGILPRSLEILGDGVQVRYRRRRSAGRRHVKTRLAVADAA
jgi:transposase